MYVIVTYARKQMRGVQVRGIRIAQGLPKDKVLFLNSGYDSWLQTFGYQVKNINLFQFFLSPDHLLPEGTECLIFPDLPTNHPGQTALLMDSMKKKIPVVIVDNLYSMGQLEESAYKNAVSVSDSFILLGLSYMKQKLADKNIILVPPLIEKPLKSESEIKEIIFRKFQIPQGKKLVLGVSYNEYVLEVIEKLAKKYQDVEFVLLGAQTAKQTNVKTVSVAGAADIVELIMASDLVLCKMGYQQMLETLALGKPLITVGKERGLRKWWMDEGMKDVVFDFKTYSSELDSLVNRILFDGKYHEQLLAKIKNLHDGSLDGIETIARTVQNVKYHPKIMPKTLLLSIVDGNLSKIKKIIRSEPFILPLIFSYPFATKTGLMNRETGRKLSDFQTEGEENLIRSDLSLIFSLSPHSAHGLVRILPWYETMVSGLDSLISGSDRIIVVGEKTKQYFEDLLTNVSKDKLEFK